jgi:hypothetical protein
MFKKSLTIITILVSVNSYAFLPDVNSLSSKIQKKLQSKKSTYVQNENQQCSQFSGSWVGTCEDANGGGKSASSFKITQENCNSITSINTEEAYSHRVDLTGGIKVETAATPLLSISTSSAASWNSDKSVIQGTLNGFINSPLIPLPTSISINYQLTLDKGQLLVFSQTTGLSLDKTETCRYNKN